MTEKSNNLSLLLKYCCDVFFVNWGSIAETDLQQSFTFWFELILVAFAVLISTAIIIIIIMIRMHQALCKLLCIISTYWNQ